ncbi:MAG: hypothetical protein QNL68_13195 [Akkermansiaceae bacterium]|jgi:hypothetical protein
MKVLFSLLLSVASLSALPNAVLGALAQHGSPLNGEDLTDLILAAGVWDGSQKLPGEWEADSGVASSSAAYLMAWPKVFGVDALLVRAMHRDEKLEELQITFADAGSYFGYLDQSLPKGMTREAAIVELRRRVEEKQLGFAKLSGEREKALRAKLAGIDDRPKESKRGRTRNLRAELSEYEDEKSSLVIHLLAAPDHWL